MKLFGLCFLLFSTVCSSQTVTFVAEELPTFHYLNQSNQPEGALVDIVHALAQHTTLKINIELMPFARAYHQTQIQPNTLLFSLLRTPSREHQFKWLGQTYQTTAYLVGLKTNTETLDSLVQAKKSRVGTIRGYYSETFLKQQGFTEENNLVLSVNFDQMWHLLFKDRIDYVLTNNIALNRELASANLPPEAVEQKLAIKDFPHDLYIASHVKIDPDTEQQITRALTLIKQNGEYQGILTRWGLALPEYTTVQ
ncbi:substrate-binding periplasmic protein [Pseudoalteromonas ulvae]|uniref:Solute-binding protein family 3/N-terminal domain-containing protein n=1 Tax=Pseudoalteromonas ulvae TaxID=107327 RepID=A0A244CMV1_PSEDV|nr:transporter substrate-binding domain-containing protein [Pseudoalteromonas ulvae]OUL56957.1 hypothetical protein B1199_16460 [Pseudoalteromonas ulvae]